MNPAEGGAPVLDDARPVSQRWLDTFDRVAENPYANTQVQRVFFTRFIRGPFIQPILQYARLPVGARVLEAGCGSARFTVCWALLGYDATALDISPTMLENARDLMRQAQKLFGRELRVKTVMGNMDEPLPLPTGAFDLVFNEGVVEHWLDDQARARVLAEMTRIAKPGRCVAIIVPNGGHPWIDYWEKHNLALRSAPPMTRYSAEKLKREMESAGLSEVVVDGINPWHSLDWGTGSRLRFLIGGMLNKLVPLPKRLRQEWGIMVVGIGRKKISDIDSHR